MFRGSRVGIRGYRGRGYVSRNFYNVNPRSDQNCFELFSDLPQDGDDLFKSGDNSDICVGNVASQGFSMVRKRQ